MEGKTIAKLEEELATAQKNLADAKKRQKDAENIDKIQALFRFYLPTKAFNPAYVIDAGGFISYIGDGVSIYYYSRTTMHLGDYDTFVDFAICVDGKKIVDKQWV